MGTLIVVPAHNEEQFLGGALRSIHRYGPKNAEIIVVDNGSVDRTAEIANSLGAQVIHINRAFPGKARNVGASVSNAEILVFLDADVELTPDWTVEFEKCAETLRSEPMQLFGSIYDLSQNPSWIERTWFAPMRHLKRSYAEGGNIVMSRTLFNLLRGFDEKLETAEDWDLCERARAVGGTIALRSNLRVHHEGYPRTALAFLKRERWHGRGDVTSLGHALRSKGLMASVIFAVLNIAALGALLPLLHGNS